MGRCTPSSSSTHNQQRQGLVLRSLQVTTCLIVGHRSASTTPKAAPPRCLLSMGTLSRQRSLLPPWRSLPLRLLSVQMLALQSPVTIDPTQLAPAIGDVADVVPIEPRR